MTDPFGHRGDKYCSTFLDVWGKGPLLLRFQGREWLFEFSRMFGPQLLKKSDWQPAHRQPDRKDHPFWAAFKAWQHGGEKHRAVRTRKGVLRFYLCYAPTNRGAMTPTPRKESE